MNPIRVSLSWKRRGESDRLRRWLVLFGATVVGCFSLVRFAGASGHRAPPLRVTLRVDLGKDLGQNFGSLFEVTDDSGNVVAGAGFLGAYNTQPRSDRRTLHFFVKPRADRIDFSVETLPRVNDDAGVYLDAFDGKLFARSRGGADGELYVWDSGSERWTADEKTTPFSIHVGNGTLSYESQRITYNGRTVLDLRSTPERIGAVYYANGFLVFRLIGPKPAQTPNRILACPWTPVQTSTIDLKQTPSVAMRTPQEFVYAYGQLGSHILAATNTGGIYRFDGKTWTTLLEPDTNVSFQIYSMINYYDRLLMGHYPTGELYEYDGKAVRLLRGWPPVMPGVSNRAREAQTTAIYGGDLYVGVWPWAEVWRYDRNTSAWSFTRRMFRHPELTEETIHPYENYTRQLGGVLNRWGQRVTSMVPLGDSLYVSTSAKGSRSIDPENKLLVGEKRKEFGLVHRLRLPGHLSVHTNWVDGPTEFQFLVGEDQIRLFQDGVLLGNVSLDPEFLAKTSLENIAWGTGVFGRFRGTILHKSFETYSAR